MSSLFCKFPKASLMVIGTNLSVPSTQLCLWHFIKLLLTKGFYWKVETIFALKLLNIALTLANSHISFVQLLYTRILRGKKPFGGLCDMKLDWVYNPLKFDLVTTMCSPRGRNLWGNVFHHNPATLTRSQHDSNLILTFQSFCVFLCW